MEMKPVVSSNISSIGYDYGTLHVKFHSGGLYRYVNVPPNIYHNLMSASSHGTYYNEYIKGKYSESKLG